MIKIRELYKPFQPGVNQPAENVAYNEFSPHTELQPFIYCYWELKSLKELSKNFSYKVASDGCIDIYFDLNEPKENYVMGFCKSFTEFNLGKYFHYVGVRFLPTVFPQLFAIAASELANRYKKLSEVVPDTANFITSYIYQSENILSIKNLFDDYFIDKIRSSDFDYDSRLYNAINIILERNGVLNIETELDTGLSPRQLRRIFDYYIGDGAKTFAKVVRFQNILRTKPSVYNLRRNKFFEFDGYFDQSHFIRDFKTFYGTTPGKAFRV